MILTQQDIKISYAVCVKDEEESFSELINFLLQHKKKQDEIIVINDNTTSLHIKKEFKKVDTVITKTLVNDFAVHKNVFFNICKGNYIFNIDADELPSEQLMLDIHKILFKNLSVELFNIPRKNFLTECDYKDLLSQKYKLGPDNMINYPDYQGRIYKNIKKLKWSRSVHERIVGSSKTKFMKPNSNYFLVHKKPYEKQLDNNKRYNYIKSMKSHEKTIGFVCCYFNPSNYLSRYLNICNFVEKLKCHGITPLIVEGYYDNSKYRINNLFENVISIKFSSVFWKKEHLLNIGIKKLLSRNYEYISWLDADIEFISPNWINNILESTDYYGISQIFTNSYDMELKPRKKSVCSYLSGSSGDDIKTIFSRVGEPGYGYCYHKSFLEKNNLFEMAILGTGDFVNLVGNYYHINLHDSFKNDRYFKGMTEDFFEYFIRWANNNKKLKNGVGCAVNDIKIFDHGTIKNRKYVSRENILKVNKFRPSKDILRKKSNQKYYKLELINNELEEVIKNYFNTRNEDSELNKISFKKNNNSAHLDKISHLPDFTKFRFQPNEQSIIILAKKTKQKISLSRILSKNKIILDSSSKPSINSHTIEQDLGLYEIYLNFIIYFYENLPKHCLFINESIKKKNYVENINNKLKNLDTISEIEPVCDKYDKVLLSPHTKINTNTTLRSWWKTNLGELYDPTFQYIQNGNFIVTNKEIWKKPKKYYEIISKNIKEFKHNDLFLSRSFLRILK